MEKDDKNYNIKLSYRDIDIITIGLKCLIQDCCEEYLADSDVEKVNYASKLTLKLMKLKENIKEQENKKYGSFKEFCEKIDNTQGGENDK